MKIKTYHDGERDIMHGRRWLARWRDGIFAQWAEDRVFRAAFSLLLAGIMLAGVGSCALFASVLGHAWFPQWFHNSGVVRVGVGPSNANYPISALHPAPAPPDGTPIPVATSPFGAPLQLPTPSPTPALTPSPSPTQTAGDIPTPTPAPTQADPTCPPLGGSPPLSGRTVQDGTNPTPLQGGCPAQLVIVAPAQVHAPVTGTLTFGTRNPLGCTVALSGTTDASGS